MGRGPAGPPARGAGPGMRVVRCPRVCGRWCQPVRSRGGGGRTSPTMPDPKGVTARAGGGRGGAVAGPVTGACGRAGVPRPFGCARAGHGRGGGSGGVGVPVGRGCLRCAGWLVRGRWVGGPWAWVVGARGWWAVRWRRGRARARREVVELVGELAAQGGGGSPGRRGSRAPRRRVWRRRRRGRGRRSVRRLRRWRGRGGRRGRRRRGSSGARSPVRGRPVRAARSPGRWR